MNVSAVSVSGTETSRGSSNLPGPDEEALEDYQVIILNFSAAFFGKGSYD